MAKLQFSAPGGKGAYEIHDEFITIGREVGNHLRLSDPAVAPVHLRVIHGKDGYRIEPADATLEVEVNGEKCGARALKPEDRIRIGDTTLTFVDERAAAPVKRAAPAAAKHAEVAHHHGHAPAHGHGHGHGHGQAHGHGQGHGHGHGPAHHAAGHGHGHGHGHEHGHARPHGPDHSHGHGHHAYKKKGPPWLMWLSICAVAFVLLIFVPPALGFGSYLREASTPEYQLKLAEEQFQKGELAAAMKSLQLADLRSPSGETKDRMDALRKKIEERTMRESDQTALDAARQLVESMQQFEQTYLAKPQPGPAARDLARKAKVWLERYTEVVKRHADHAGDVLKVQLMYDRYAPLAKLDRPDDSADVLFAVDQRMALARPQYRDAVYQIDDYLRTHPNDSGAGALRDRRTKISQRAREEFDRREASARRYLAGGQLTDAKKELDAMRDAIVDDTWGKIADAVEKDIQRAEKK
jgi:pSer/pThr/pTyr-binding forkhead associated (FHA) protein